VNIGAQGFVMNGQRVTGAGQTIAVVNPATGKEMGSVPDCTGAEIDAAVRAAHQTFESDAWRRMPPADRGRLLSAFAKVIRDNEKLLAELETADVGKPLNQALNDVRTTARYFEYYGGLADKVQGATIPVRWGALDFTLREPFGVSAQIIPWNFPLAMAARGIAPALAAGNCVVAKPAEDASLSVLKLAELAIEAGFPDNAFNVVTGYGATAGASLVGHPLVRHVTFTGSVRTGTAVMKTAADGIKPVSLELGGKSPNIVLDDADLALSAEVIARSILINAGQTCNSCPRLLVHESVQQALTQSLKERFRSLKIGDPMENPDLGPLVSARHRQNVERYVELAHEQGGVVSRYGVTPAATHLAGGYFVLPTIVEGVVKEHAIFSEEVFGPVLAITSFRDVDEAVALANASDYGLNAGIFSKSMANVMPLMQRLNAGMIYVNGYGAGGGVEVPFGGFKKSGIGREKGVDAILNYTQVKSVTVHY
jgi:aldehyde dehydrogenase (NAD+)